MKIFFSVGEPSGDQHAAHLIHALRKRRPDWEYCGYGGPEMEQAGCQIHYRLTNLAVMGILRVLPLIFQFLKLVKQAKTFFQTERPDLVILVDFPGFNWWIARRARQAGIPVVYYLPPQLWAWAPWRIRRVRKTVNYVVSALPFEAEWYEQRGIQVEYVGHPFFDEVAAKKLDADFHRRWITPGVFNIGILPGSRKHEVEKNFPLQLEVMRQVGQRFPHVRFLVACYKPEHRELCRLMEEDAGVDLPIRYFVGKTPEVIDAAACCLMVSGSVSLELMARHTPAVVIYQISPVIHLLSNFLLNVEYISLPNLIAGRELMPEHIISTHSKNALRAIAAQLETWVFRPETLSATRRELAELDARYGKTGATDRTADYLVNLFGSQPIEVPRAA